MAGNISPNVSNINVSQEIDNNEYLPWAESFIYIFEAYVQPTTLAVGIITNIINLIVLSKIRLINIFRIVLIALAISDLLATICGFLQLVLEVIFYAGEVPFGHWELKAVTNYALYFLFVQFLCTSGTIVVVFTGMRNVLVAKPIKSKTYLTTKRVKLSCVFCFLLTGLLYVPTSLNVIWQGCYMSVNTTDFCSDVFERVPIIEEVANKYLFSLTILYGPILLVIYIISIIFIKYSLRKSNRFLSSMGSSHSDSNLTVNRSYLRKRNEQSAKLTRTLFLILVLDAICIIPTILVGIGLLTTPQDTIFGKRKTELDVLDVIAEECLNFRPLYNFWLYCFTQKEFRVCFLKMSGINWCCVKLRGSKTKRQSSCENELIRSSLNGEGYHDSSMDNYGTLNIARSDLSIADKPCHM